MENKIEINGIYMKYEINSKIFKSNINQDTRICYVNVPTLLKNKIFNGSWNLIKYRENKTMSYIVCMDYGDENEEICQDDKIYITPFLAYILQIISGTDIENSVNSNSSSDIIISSIYDEIEPSQIKYKFTDIISENNENLDFNIKNLPCVRKLKVMMLGNNLKSHCDTIIYNIKNSKKIKIVSLNEIFVVNDDLILDPYYGIITNKNDFSYFIITEIEYEEYDFLRNYININNRQIINTFNTSKNERSLKLINAFYITENNLEIEIIKNDFSKTIQLPRSSLRYLNNSVIPKHYSEIFDNLFIKNLYHNMKSTIDCSSTVFLIGPSHCALNYTIRYLSDENGLHFIKKNLKKFDSAEQFITYLKRIEFQTPCIINFKNSQKLNNLFDDVNSSVFTELKNILKYHRKKKNLIYIFSFENSTDIGNYLKILCDSIIEYTLPDLNLRKDLIKIGFENCFYNVSRIFGSKFGEKFMKIAERLSDLENINNPNENYFELAKLTVGYDIKELKSFIKFCFYEFYNRQNSMIFDLEFVKSCHKKIKQTRFKTDKSTSIIPEIKWEDVGGLEYAKEDINETIELPIKYPKLFENTQKRRSGLLLFGPPGSGKTLLAKAIANECSMNFISIKGPELLNMYVGESEKNIREVFERGRSNPPCCIFFDEIDALAPARSKNSDQGNVTDRIVAQFMTEMDGVTKGNSLIVIASTNRPDLVDPSLLRPGRFDKIIYVGMPSTVEEKIKIYRAQTNNLKLNDDVDYETLAKLSHSDYSGADIYAVCSQAFTLAFKEKLLIGCENSTKDIIVDMSHFKKAINKISPSLSRSEIVKYEELKNKYNK